MRKHIFLFLIIAISLSGCAVKQKRVFNQEEWSQITSRKYINTSQDEILKAAEKIFQLADASDTKIYNYKDKLLASRHYSSFMPPFYMIEGNYEFEIQTTNLSENQLEVILLIKESGHVTVGAFSGLIVDSPEVYSLFFNRLDSIINKTAWMSCSEAQNIYSINSRPNLAPLCNHADDNAPL